MHAKQIKTGAVLLIAGTCIGSGMIALPMVLANLGLIPSILLMLFIWFIMYYTSLINVELNLQAGRGLTLGSLGRLYSGKMAELIGVGSLKLLSYSLLAVFIYGGSSVVQELIKSNSLMEYSFNRIATYYALISIGLLLLPLKAIDYINRLLFIGLLAIISILVAGLVLSVDWTDMPLFAPKWRDLTSWLGLLPVVFTSFGFQVIFHTVTNYCHRDSKILKQAFLWGSLIPAIVYIVWSCSVLSVIHHNNPAFYSQMAAGEVEVGELIQALSQIAEWPAVQLLVWCISILAVSTSVIGVGIGLCDSLKNMLAVKIPNENARNLLAAILTILPAYLVVLYVPNAFISVLGFAGMILAVIAILLPVYLFQKLNAKKFHYPELKATWLIALSTAVGILVVVSELFNIISAH
ncbi:putative Tyrosine-specific transport protein [Candidatus Protochlamydia naegleriophila]|uniref:Putative Tyrosine-specific transport protein n=1 Tax=Candidatus Protochlamydia naegleriophila TaxID=389348 RepID=A0A0U5JBX2_9BACT|nr:aromatic amino acid transport family protein [Candidatus Protochlamydia naegleriophila]CUI16926.1 putative Tyrosine-specific transport protein [Candidatus Protochlamydia naegleriophila]